MRWVEKWTKAQAWGCPCHPKKYPISTSVKAWGCPRGTPLLHRQNSGHLSKHYIFIASCIMRFSWSVLFLFSVFFCFVCCNKWFDHIMLFWREMNSIFHLPRTLRFSLLSFNECSLFLLLHLALVFRLDFCSDLALSLHQGVFGPLVHVGFNQKSFL
jgi:hypothetical protein